MTLTPSTMLPLGTELPVFKLPIIRGKWAELGSFNPKTTEVTFLENEDINELPVLIMLLCAHCPFVKHVELELAKIDKTYGKRLQMIAVSSNSLITHPQDDPKHLADQSKRLGWSFPYLFDADQNLAKALQAACTPDFFLFSRNKSRVHTLCYRGQLDESRPGNDLPVTGRDLRSAIEAVLSGEEVAIDQKPSIGCNIKWHPGAEPQWFG